MQSVIIKNQLIAPHPSLTDYLLRLPEISLLKPKDITVLGAISKIIIGQMLSRKAANTIISRVESLAAEKEKYEIALLSVEEMRSCGINNSKAKAIKLFTEQYFIDGDRYENRRNLDNTGLFYEVIKH